MHGALPASATSVASPSAGLLPPFRLAEGTAIVQLGDRTAAFSEREQTLFALNDSAALLGSMLRGGCSFEGLVNGIVERGFDPAQAAATVHSFLLHWSQSGLAVADPPSPATEPALVQHIRVGDRSMRLAYDAALAARVAPTFDHLRAECAGPCTDYSLWTEVGLAFVGRNGPAAIVTPRQAAPVLKASLTEAVLAATGEQIALHAACVTRGGRALLLSGPPGAGKTTLALALATTGFDYQGDDIAILRRDGTVSGVPFAPAVKAGAWGLVGAFRPDLCTTMVHERLDGKRVRYLPPPGGAKTQPLPLGWLIRLDRGGDGPASLAPLHPADALADLIAGAYSAARTLSVPLLEALVGAMTGARLNTLRYARADDAAKTLRLLCGDG